VFFIVFGLVLLLIEKLPFGFGKLPGDIFIKRDIFTYYFPLATSLLISLLLALILLAQIKEKVKERSGTIC